VQVSRPYRRRSALPPVSSGLNVRPNTTFRHETKSTQFHPARHLPQLKQTRTQSLPIPNPLVELLCSSLVSPPSLHPSSLAGDLFDFGQSPKSLGDSLFGVPQASAPYRSLVDGPIRTKPTIEDELLFHPLDEVMVIDPKTFAHDNPHLAGYKAITNEEFAAVANRLGLSSSHGIVASISGGPDSMAMAILLAQYCTDQNVPLLCMTIDHALRPEAPAEALVTQGWLHSRGIPHVIVRVEWQGNIPTHCIQSKARDARYEAITRVARELQSRLSSPTSTALVHVLMAHTADDNVETFILRMAGCSGLYGLAGIAETRKLEHHIVLARPLLEFAKNRLYATLIETNQPWASDPTNAKLLYKRNQVRHTLESIYSKPTPNTSKVNQSRNIIGIGDTKKAEVAEDDDNVSLEDLQELQLRFSMARFHLDSITHRFCSEYAGVSKKYGYVVVPTLALLHLPEIFVLRVLDTILAHVSGSGVPTRLKSLKSCLTQIRTISKLIDVGGDGHGEGKGEGQKERLRKGGSRKSGDITYDGKASKKPSAKVSVSNRPICVHHCIVVQSRHKLTFSMQNVPCAPAILCGDRKPLPPYRADTKVKLGSVMHWLDTWKVTYHLKPAIARPSDVISELPSELYIRQIQPSDLPILRRIDQWNALQVKLSKETLMSLPIIVDDHSRPVYLSFAETMIDIHDPEQMAPMKMRKALKALATITLEFLPKHSMTEPPASTFVGYHTFSQNELKLGNNSKL